MPESLEQPEPPSEPDRHRRKMAKEPLTNAALALLPPFACFLGGATQKWAEGLVLVFLGGFLLVRPPRRSLGWVINCILLGLIVAAALAFLPARWFFIPAWRIAAVEDLGIVLPGTVTPQPWLTAGALVSLIAGICWTYRVATIDLDLRASRFVLRLFVSAIVFLAVISLLLYWAHSAFSFWINERGFGPFPNRNQTADLFGITSIVLLACIQDDLRHRRIRWVFGAAGLIILIAAIIVNFSRAGIAILVGGSFLWIIVVVLRTRSTARIALGISFLLMLLTALLLLGGPTLQRFQQWGTGGPGISSDFRWNIFHDTFQLIRNSPWCGIGLANFNAVFGVFRKESIGELTVLHPESDWLWLRAEAGWPAVVLTVLGGILVLWHVLPLQEGTNQRFRLAAFLAALIFALHGLVDVSAHRVGTAYSGLFLLGLALHRPLRLKLSRSTPILFRGIGALLLIMGATWAITTQTRTLIPGGVGVSNAKKLSAAANENRNFNETIQLTTQAMGWAPLDWQLYFSRALAEVAAKQPRNAIGDFRRARFLEPVAYELPLAEGSAWLSSQPTLAATAWRDALRKAGRKRAEVFANMLTTATLRSREVNQILEQYGLSQADLALAYLGRLSGPAFQEGVEKLLQKDPQLEMLNEPQKFAFFSSWSDRGDLDKLAQIISAHPDWLRYAWFGMAKYDASKNDFHAAYNLTQRFGEAVAMPRLSGGATLQELQNRYATNPDNIAVGFALYQMQMQDGRVDDALNTARHFTGRPTAPPYFYVLEAECWAKKQNWERAWTAWLAYRNASVKK
jgi:hypothetical protein